MNRTSWSRARMRLVLGALSVLIWACGVVSAAAAPPPTGSITSPANGTVVRTSPVTITGTWDNGSEVAPQIVCSRSDGNGSTVTGSEDGTYSCTVPLLEGSNIISVTIPGLLPLQTPWTGQVTVTLDTVAPTVAITSPADGSFTTQTTSLTVTGTINDSTATVTVNGQAATISGTTFTAANVAIGSGATQVFTAVATDPAGNQAQATSTVGILRSPMTVAITGPTQAYLPGPQILVQGTVNSEAPPVTVDVNGTAVTVTGTTFSGLLPVVDGALTLVATAHDAAGRTVASSPVSLHIDTVGPTVVVDSPAHIATRATSWHFSGTADDASPSTIYLIQNGDLQNAVTTPVVAGQWSVDLPLPTEGHIALTIQGRDVAGNWSASSTSIALDVDRTAPTITILSPTEGSIWTFQPITVIGIQNDSTGVVTVDGVAATHQVGVSWYAIIGNLPDGQHTFVVHSTDPAGNVGTATVTINLATTSPAPTITITAPANGTVTTAATIDVSGTVADTTSVTIGSLTGTIVDNAFTVTGVPLTEGDNTIVAHASNDSGQSTDATVLVTRDITAPSITLDAPDRLTRVKTGVALATVTDAVGVAQVVMKVQGTVVGTFTEAPYAITIAVPDGLAIGDTFTVTTTATDRAGNVSTASRDVRIAADGVIAGHVLSDASSLPLPGATVRIGSDTRITDARGLYTLPTEQASVTMTIEHDGMTSVSRVVATTSGVAAVPMDARLTPLAPAVTIGVSGGVLTTPASADATVPTVGITIAANAVAADAPVQLTPLSGQGLPELLPLGWSPLAAFDLRSGAAGIGTPDLSIGFTTAQRALFTGASTLVQLHPMTHTWHVVARDLGPDQAGVVHATLPGLGAYALVLGDAQPTAPAVPAIGEALTGLAVAEVPIAATSVGLASPAVIPPTGGTSQGQVTLQSPTALPSGTVVQVEINESYTLPGGDVASIEPRLADVILYGAPARPATPTGGAPATAPLLSAAFAITPSHTFDPADLIEGEIHLDILAGREYVRGVSGGREAATVTAGDATLVVPAHALTEDTAMAMTAEPAFSAFLPANAALTPLRELVIDVSGRTLTAPAELSIGANGATTGTFVIARVDRIDDVPALTVVALAQVQGDRLVTQPASALPGIVQGGRYVVYAVNGAIGFVAGVTSASGSPVFSVVSSDQLPFIAQTGTDGHYTLVALAAANVITARVPHSSLATSGSVTVPANGTATLDLTLAATVTTATIAPANGARNVAATVQVQVTSPNPINPASVSTDAVRLLKVNPDTTTTVVPVRLVLAGTRLILSVVPLAPLAPDTDYRTDIGGLADTHGGLIAVPTSTFHTQVTAAPTYSADDLTFSFPDANGVVTVTAPANSFPLGTRFLIINSTSGEVVSISTLNDGSVSGQIRATTSDRLVLTITDPDGRVTTVNRSQFFDAATGQTAIGPGGGTVKGPEGLELRVPDGSVQQGVALKIDKMTAADFPLLPPVPNASFGGAMRIHASPDAVFGKEVDVAFPIPAEVIAATQAVGRTPKDAFFYVYRRSIAPDGKPLFETVDYANVEGEGANARIVTASFPFQGLIGLLDGAEIILQFTFDYFHFGEPTTGVITGQVLQPQIDPTTRAVTYVPVPNQLVLRDDPAAPGEDSHEGVKTDQNGRFTFNDARFISTPVDVVTTYQGVDIHARVFAVERADTRTLADPALAVLIQKNVYKQIATANLTLPLATAPVPASPITIQLFTTQNGDRVRVPGIVNEGTQVTIGIDAGTSTVTAIDINGFTLGAQRDPAAQQVPRDPISFGYISTQPYLPLTSGTYVVTVTALPPTGQPVTASTTFRMIAAGGGLTTDPNAPPSVIDGLTTPRNGETAVDVLVFPQVAFNEPVKNVPGNATLLDDQGQVVPTRLLAVGVDGSGNPITIDGLTSADAAITSLTFQPVLGLARGKQYRVVLTNQIVDLDPQPKPLTPYESRFTTLGPSTLPGGQETFASAGVAVTNGHAYLAQSFYAGGVGGLQAGSLRTFDLASPAQPQEVLPALPIGGPPRDLAADNTTLILATAPRTQLQLQSTPDNYFYDIASSPSNLLVYDVTNGTPSWVGATSLTDNVLDGTITRVVVRGETAYAATMRKGLQVVDLSRAKANFKTLDPFQRDFALFAPGGGLNRDAVVATMRVREPGDTAVAPNFRSLAVGDYSVLGVPSTLIFSTATETAFGLVIANSVTTDIVFKGSLQDSNGSLGQGQAIALARAGVQDLVLVGGYGTTTTAGSKGVVAIVDISQPNAPTILAWIALPHSVGDIAITGTTAIVSSDHGEPTDAGQPGRATIINFADPQHPWIAGELSGVGSRLALSSDGILYSTDQSYLSGDVTSLSGLRSASLGRLAYISAITPSPIALVNGKSTAVVRIEARTVPSNYQVTTADIELYKNNVLLTTLPASVIGGYVAQLPAGYDFDIDALYEARVVFNRGITGKQLISGRKALRPAAIAFTGTPQAPGATPANMIRMTETRPVVTIDRPDVESSHPPSVGDTLARQTIIRGTVTDLIAPINEVQIGDTRTTVTQSSHQPGQPYVGTFQQQILVWGQDSLVSVSATNANGHLGWDSVSIQTKQQSAQPISLFPAERSSMPAADLNSQAAAPFQLTVKDRGMGTISTVTAVVDTGVEQKTVRLTRQGQGPLYVSAPLYLVPSTFQIAPNTDAATTQELQETRIRGKLGTVITVTYGNPEILDRAVASGVQFIDSHGDASPFVPGDILRPEVQITSLDVNDGSGGAIPTATVSGTVSDPVAKQLGNSHKPTLRVLGIGTPSSPIALLETGEGMFSFTVSGVQLPHLANHLQVRAVNSTGAWGVADRLVAIKTNDLGQVTGHEVAPGVEPAFASPAASAFKVRLYAAHVDPATVQGTVTGVVSYEVDSLHKPAPVTLTFGSTDDGSGVWHYDSAESVVPARLPSHRFVTATTPDTMADTPSIVPVEVAGFLRANVTAGALGAIVGVSDVSGFELVAPRDGALIDASENFLFDHSGFNLAVSAKWRNLSSAQGRLGLLQTTETSNDPCVVDQTVPLSHLPFTGVGGVVTVPVRPGDAVVRAATEEAGFFTYTPSFVANPTTIDANYQDPGGQRVSRGAYFLPEVLDGVDLLFLSNSDSFISDYLLRHGLRPIGMKRKGGTLVTVQRIDGLDAWADQDISTPDGPTTAAERPRPEQPVDGGDVLFRDVVNEGFGGQWEQSYSAPNPSDGLVARSKIIQKVREKLNLPQRPNGYSIEFQEFRDAARRDLIDALLTASMALDFEALLIDWGPIEAPKFAEGTGFVVSDGSVNVIESIDVTTKAVTMINKKGQRIIPPIADVEADYTMATGQTSIVDPLSDKYRQLQVEEFHAREKGEIDLADKLLGQRTTVSRDLGIKGAEFVADSHFSFTARGYQKICCSGPTSGGGARKVFDDVWFNPVDNTVHIVEAKGGKTYYNISSAKGAGRQVKIGDETVFALQGSPEYIDATIDLMLRSSKPEIFQAAQKLDYARSHGLLKYHFSSSTWWDSASRLTVRGSQLVWRPAPAIRVTTVKYPR